MTRRGVLGQQSLRIKDGACRGVTEWRDFLLAVADPNVDAWHRVQAIARELAERNRTRLWTQARRRGQIR